MIQITDQDGRMLAFGSTRCLIADVPVDVGADYAPPRLGPTDSADPYLRRPPDGDYFNLDQVMNGTPIELQRRTITGLLAWAAEFTMGAAVYSTLGPGDVFATLDMHIRFTRPALIDSGNLFLEASVNHRGRRLRVSSCNVNNAEGKRVAMATSSALLVEGGVRELRNGRLPEEILAESEPAH